MLESKSPVLTTISPITLKPIFTRQELTPEEIPAIVTKSTKAFSTFRQNYDLKARQNIVWKALSILEERADGLAKDLTEQMGRPIQYCAKEIKTAVLRGKYMWTISTEALKDVPGEEEAGFRRYIRKEAIGPVLVVFAWNVCGF